MPSDNGMHLHVYGIRNCDTVRAALKWLDARGVAHTFHDFRVEGVAEEELRQWVASTQGPRLLNKRSTTWRQLTDEQKNDALNDPVPLFLNNPTLIKRPVFTDGDTVLDVGFTPNSLEEYI